MFKMRFTVLLIFISWVQAALHHLFVGTVDGNALYALSLDDEYKVLDLVQKSSAAGASPSIVLDRSKLFLFGSKPSDGTISRYAVGTDFSLTLEGTMEIPGSCNTTSFKSIKLASGLRSANNIYGSVSTGSCSALFSTSVSGYYRLRSKEISGDVRSLAFSPDGRHLHALDFKTNTVFNFLIDEEPSLETLNGTDTIPNVTTSRQLVTHPTGHRLYVITQDTNELIDIPLLSNDHIDASLPSTHHTILPKNTSPGEFFTSSVAIPSSNNTLWTLSQSATQAQITVFRLDAATGQVLEKIARAAFKNAGGSAEQVTSALMAAPFDGDLVAVTTFPGGMVAVMGLETPAEGAPKVKSFGRWVFHDDPGCCGDGVWVN